MQRVRHGATASPLWARASGPHVGRWPAAPGAPGAAGRASVVERIARHAATLLDAPFSMVSLAGEEAHLVREDGCLAPRPADAIPPSHSICRHVVALDRPVLIADTAVSDLEEARLAARDLQTLAYAGVPIHSPSGAVLGTVCVGDDHRRLWSAADTAVLLELAEIAAFELELEGELRAARELDALTGLPNRATCETLLRERQRLARARGSAVATLVVGLHQLALVNESSGRAAGDALLVALTGHLVAVLPDCAVARISGDELAVVGDARDEHEAMALADRLREALRRPLTVAGHELELFASIGIVIGDADDDPSGLLDAASAAVVQARNAPNDVLPTSDGPARERATTRLRIDSALRRAVEAGELDVHYQPLLDLRRDTLSGFEALVRWTSPDLGPIAPVDFIPAAEESGMIGAIGRCVLERACADAVAWGPLDASGRVGVSVNLSPVQLTAGLPTTVTDVLRRTGLDPSRLTLELTETALVAVDDVTAGVLAQISALGVHLALDDFGTGFSSLYQLANLPLDVLKIDRSFIARLDEPRTRTIVAATIAMARSLDLSVTAEGIETAEQRLRVAALGCTHGQGFGLGRPEDVQAARERVRRSR